MTRKQIYAKLVAIYMCEPINLLLLLPASSKLNKWKWQLLWKTQLKCLRSVWHSAFIVQQQQRTWNATVREREGPSFASNAHLRGIDAREQTGLRIMFVTRNSLFGISCSWAFVWTSFDAILPFSIFHSVSVILLNSLFSFLFLCTFRLPCLNDTLRRLVHCGSLLHSQPV